MKKRRDNGMSFDNIDTPQELLDYMGNNIKYGFITKDGKKEFNNYSNFYDECIVQTGKELLITKVGTCWDQVELERMWFIEHGYNIKTYFLFFESGGSLPTHTFLIYEDNGIWYWFENAFFNHRGIHKYSSIKEALEEVKKKQIEYAKVKEEVKSCEYEVINKCMTVGEYLKHVKNEI